MQRHPTGRPQRVIITEEGRIICPDCKKYFGRASYNANARGIVLWCGNCKKEVTLRVIKHARS